MITKYQISGNILRDQAKDLVLSYLKHNEDCWPNCEGIKQAELFRECGLDWGEQPNATSSQQQYWLVGMLRDFESQAIIERDKTTKKWRLK